MLSVRGSSVLVADHPDPVELDVAISVISVAELHLGVLVAPDDVRHLDGLIDIVSR
jgi:hypothetical protein